MVKHVETFAILSEGSISKGIRRIVAVTGQEAKRAFNQRDVIDQTVKDIELMFEKDSKNRSSILKKVMETLDEVNASILPLSAKTQFVEKLNAIKVKCDKLNRDELLMFEDKVFSLISILRLFFFNYFIIMVL